MGKNLSYVLFLLWFCYLIVSSILLFTRGFLLTREVQDNNSTCLSYKEIPCTPVQPSLKTQHANKTNKNENQCSDVEKIASVLREYSSASSICLPPRARVVLLIVDALRYDFTVFNEKNENPLPFQNKLPVIYNLNKNFPNSTCLLKFIADPPTTTMQRLKGLTTGSLPTFIDAGSNFATSEITEDNIIDQLIRNNYKTVFMGDDTWNGLYPNRFIRNYPYPSFNVWDLDTVDYGVRNTLSHELNNTDWNLLIGHFLGVDHCGHRYGPNHPEMERKLTEINTIIENVAESIDDRTMLFVIGDHGMTITGDHGGESEDEVTAALFVYSKRPLITTVEHTESIKQVDLVPTLSFLLGVSTPFQNLGALVVDCLPVMDVDKDIEEWQVSLLALWSNVQQVMEYITSYSENTDTFSEEMLKNFYEKYAVLSAKIFSINSEEKFAEFSKELKDFVVALRTMCEEVWVQFDSFSMARGMLFLFISMFFVYLIIDGIPVKQLPDIFRSSFLSVSYSVLALAAIVSTILFQLNLVENLLLSIFFTTGVVSQFMLVMLIIQNWEVISLNWYVRSKKERIPNLVCRIVLVFNLCGLFSNSYIIEEASVLLFLLVTVILVCTIGINASTAPESNTKRKTEKFDTFKWSKFKLFFYSIVIAALVRASMYFWRCRAEQQWCFASPHEVSNIISKTETTKLQWLLTVIFLAIFVIVTKIWLKNCGNLNGYSITITQIKFLPTVLVVCIAGYWVLRRLPNRKPTNLTSVNYLALTVYSLTSLGILSLILKPLCTYILPGENDLVVHSDSNIIPQLYKRIKECFVEKKEKGRRREDVPVVCGLGTVYSAVFIIIGIYLTLLFSLLLGDAVAPSAVIMFITTAFVLIVTSIFRIEKSESIEALFDIPNMSVLIWVILAQYFFYASGHQPTFPNISWDAAFVGMSGDFNYNFIPATLIIINTFCSHILMGILLPLVLITPFTIFVMLPSSVAKRKELYLAAQRGEVTLFERSDLLTTSAFTLCCKYIMGHGIRVFASMLAATIHCRHLMVWNIFAPKLIFESIGMLITLASVLVGYLILLRINSKVEKLIIKLNKMS